MALSDHEHRVLESLEQALYDHDPLFVQRLTSKGAPTLAKRRVGLSALGSVLGLVLLLGFCWTTSVLMGAVGYVVMVASLDTLWINVRKIIDQKDGDLSGLPTMDQIDRET